MVWFSPLRHPHFNLQNLGSKKKKNSIDISKEIENYSCYE